MGKKVFLVFTLLSVSLWSLQKVQAADPFLGCKYFCESQYNPALNPKGYDNCLVQTQMEGYCGSKPSTGRTTMPAADARNVSPTPQQQQQQTQNQNNNSQAAQCQAQFAQLYQQCETKLSETDSTCDEKNDAGMNSVSATASQVALMMGQQTSASIQAACSKMADISQAANGAVAAYRLMCSGAIKDCRSACADLVNFSKSNSNCFVNSPSGNIDLPNVSESARQITLQLRNQNSLAMVSSAEAIAGRCNNYDAKMNEAQQAIQNYGMTAANASQCAQLSKGTTAAVPEYCKANPTAVGCNPAAPVDCTNPTEATSNKVCVCSVNPHDPMCSSSQKAISDGGNTSLIDSSSRVASGGAEDFSGDLPNLPPVMPGKPSSGGPGQAVDGSQGGGTLSATGTGSGASAGARSGNSAEGASGAANSHDVLSGYYGGGGSGYKGGYGSGDGGSRGARGVAAQNAGAVKGSGGPDLRQFLPGGKYDPRARGLAGAAGPDGITGPHSNIWQKIQNRYQVVSPSLMP